METSLTPLECTILISNLRSPDQDLPCCEYLLDAGCDPTIPIFEYGYENEVSQNLTANPFWHTFFKGNIVKQLHPAIILCSALTEAILELNEDDAR